MSSADPTDSRRPRGRTHTPEPFDPGPEFGYDPSRMRRPAEHERDLRSHTAGPGPFDPGPEFGYDPSRAHGAAERIVEAEPPWEELAELEAETAEPERPAPAPEPPEPKPEPPDLEPEPPEPEPPAPGPEPEPAPAGPEAVDSLDPAPWIPRTPPVPMPRPASRPPRRCPVRRARPRRRQPRSRGRVLALSAVLATVGAWVVPLSPLDSDRGAGPRGSASLAGASLSAAQELKQETPSSLAITSNAGPFHPVRMRGPMDYGDSGAQFGAARAAHSHEGQDIMADPGTPLVAVRDAVVIKTGNDGGRGNYVALYNPSEDQTYVYFHLLRPSQLNPGDEVPAGAEVGAMGCTGSCYGTHLHFEVRSGDSIEAKPVDPLPMLRRWPQAPAG
jgi:murein DD-endopeptidase MepM/ murein hydrolase activator NlpD